MRDPMMKRIPREIKRDIGKYIALFVFLTALIGFISGFIIGDESLKARYDTSFSEFKVEDGHFILDRKATEKIIDRIEDLGVDVCPLFYKEKEIKATGPADGDEARIYKIREKVNLSDVWEGREPEEDDEISVDRLYAGNNDLKIGDTVKIEGETFRITGLTALSDYSALFRNNADTMFDATDFTTALVTEDGFDRIGKRGIKYCYAWRDHDRNMTVQERHEREEEIKDELIDAVTDAAMSEGTLIGIEDFVGRQQNQAVTFAGADMGKDRVMMVTLLYIVIVIMAFVFGITVKSTIEKEAKAIGTLRATGYSRGEMLRHYMTVPMIVTLSGATAGNICGYTFMKDLCAGMYLNSYSLLPYKTLWSINAFRDTTLIPAAIIFLVILAVISRELRLSPLQFLREEFSKEGSRRVIRLKTGSFMSRYRKRVLMQNIPSYVIMFFGIFFSVVVMLFCLGMWPLLQHYEEIVMDSGMAEYQYILKEPYKVRAKHAEKYQVIGLKNADDRGEDVTVYGISDDSEYLSDIKLPDSDDEVVVSSAYASKYGLKRGSIAKVKEEYKKKVYSLKVAEIYDYEAQLCMFMDIDRFNRTFGRDKGEYAGYFSDVKLSEIPEDKVASVITKEDYATITKQLDSSMGDLFELFSIFGVVIFVIVIYLLSRVLIEKNARSIAMSKILGYSNVEISSIYNRVTTIVVFVSLIVCLPLGYYLFGIIFKVMMMFFTGWLTYYMDPTVYIKIVIIGMVSYMFVHVLQLRRIRKIPMGEVLKGME